MSYLEILQWLNTALSVLSVENVNALFNMLESWMSSLDSFLKKVGINQPQVENLETEPTDEERACENQIALKLQTTNAGAMTGAAAAFDFSRIRKLLKMAKDSGLLDVLIAALVPKVPLQLNTGESPVAAVPSGIAPPDLNQKK